VDTPPADARLFPRLRFWLRHGFRCEHARWRPGSLGRADGWFMINGGMAQVRYCWTCGHADFR
jgi:hypothetical protein